MQTLGGFTLVAPLDAHGGFVDRFIARAPHGGLVTLQVLHRHLVDDPSFVNLIADSADLGRRVRHPNLIATLSSEHREGHHFIVNEYVAGLSLQQVIDLLGDAEVPWAVAAFAVRAIADALAAVHSATSSQGQPLGLVLREVNPDAIVVGDDGRVRLRFSTLPWARSDRRERTQPGILKGRFAYMAPEQIRGMPVDGRADVFALALVLYETLTGKRAFSADSDFGLLERVRNGDLEVPLREARPDLPEGLAAVFDAAFAHDRDERLSAAQFRDALTPFTTGDEGPVDEEALAFVLEAFDPEGVAARREVGRDASANANVVGAFVIDDDGAEVVPPGKR